jgi:hypothetical protein
MAIKGTVRLTITVPASTKEAIRELAKRMNMSEAGAAQHLLKLGLTTEAVAFNGGEVTATFPDGRQRVLADKHGNYLYRLTSPSS